MQVDLTSHWQAASLVGEPSVDSCLSTSWWGAVAPSHAFRARQITCQRVLLGAVCQPGQCPHPQKAEHPWLLWPCMNLPKANQSLRAFAALPETPAFCPLQPFAGKRTVISAGVLPWDQPIHQDHYLAFGPDGWLHLPQGALTNTDCTPLSNTLGRCALLRMRPDGSGLETYARGESSSPLEDGLPSWHLIAGSRALSCTPMHVQTASLG